MYTVRKVLAVEDVITFDMNNRGLGKLTVLIVNPTKLMSWIHSFTHSIVY